MAVGLFIIVPVELYKLSVSLQSSFTVGIAAETMDNMKAAKSLGKQISYQFGYSNLTFDCFAYG